jgi:uncharacterized ParB-like nuclease family protein
VTVKRKELPIDRVRIDGDTQMRASIDNHTVAEYAEALIEGEQFPPVCVVFDGKDYWLWDGFHRYHAYRKAGFASITCEIINGTKRDAILLAAGANASHGLKRSNADKRQAVETLLKDKEWATKSDRWIAEQCRVSDPFVGKIRAELTANICSQRTGQDGRTINTAGIGKRNPPAGNQDPTNNVISQPASPPPVATTTISAPDRIHDDKPDRRIDVERRVSEPQRPLAPTIADVLSRINSAGDAIEGYAASDEGRSVDVPKALGHLKNCKAVVAGVGSRAHVIATDVTLPPAIDTPDGRAALDEWLIHKRKRGEGYKDAGQVEKQLKRFESFTAAEFRQAVDYSIGQNYAGLFEEKKVGRRHASARQPGPGERFDPDAGTVTL